jgi:hypothetical protein
MTTPSGGFGIQAIDIGINSILSEDSVNRCLNVTYDAASNPSLNMGQQLRRFCQAGLVLSVGDAVYISGTTGAGIPIVSKADNTSELISYCIGLCETAAASGADVWVISRGTFTGINTLTYTVGDALYLSTTGTMTNVHPIIPGIQVVSLAVVQTVVASGLVHVDIQHRGLITWDGRDHHITRANLVTGAAPTVAEISVPRTGDTAKVVLTSRLIEMWSYGTSWVLDLTRQPSNNHIFINNDSITLAAIKTPTLAEVSTFAGDATDVLLYYTGTNVTTDTPTFVYHIDNSQHVSVIYRRNKCYSVKSTVYFENIGLTPLLISGMSATPLSGRYRIDFNTQFNTTLANITAQSVSDLNDLYDNLALLPSTGSMPVFTTGTSISPGVYDTAAAIAPTGTITLNGGGATDPIFVFRTSAGALTFAAGSDLVLTNGATNNNVFFSAFGAITFNANSNPKGTCIGKSTVTVGSGAALQGRAFSSNGAVTNSSGNIYVPTLSSPYDLGVLSNFALFTSSGALTNSGAGVIVGDIGTNNGAITGFGTATISGTIYPQAQGSSQVDVSIYINEIIQTGSTRGRTNSITKEDIILSDVVDVVDGDVISIRVLNSIGISRFYNRNLILTEIQC